VECRADAARRLTGALLVADKGAREWLDFNQNGWIEGF
jgi:hypothetical protein